MIFTCYSCKCNVTDNVYMAFDYSFCSKDCRNNYYKINYQKKNSIKKANSIKDLRIYPINGDNEIIKNNNEIIKNNNEIIKNTNNDINESRNKKMINYIKNRICSREIFSIFNILLL